MKLVIRADSSFKRRILQLILDIYNLDRINQIVGNDWLNIHQLDREILVTSLWREEGTLNFTSVIEYPEVSPDIKKCDEIGRVPSFSHFKNRLMSAWRSSDTYKNITYGTRYLFNWRIMGRIKKAAAEYERRIEEEVYVTLDDGTKEPRWEHRDKLELSDDNDPNYKRRVVTAANRYGNYVVTGIRHYCKHMGAQIALAGGTKNLRAYAWFHNGRKGPTEEQGFTCNFGLYLSRKEAMELALERDQFFGYYKPRHLSSALFSEMIH